MADMDMRVVGVLSANGNPTGDKRRIQADAVRYGTPLPLRWQREDFGGHNGAVVVGSIDRIKQAPSGELMYVGKLFDTEMGRACRDEMEARYAASGLKYGISVDLDDVIAESDEDDEEMMNVSEARLRGATLCDIPAYASAYTMLQSQVPVTALTAAAALSDAGFLEIAEHLFDVARDAGLIEVDHIREEDGVIFYNLEQGALIAAGSPREDTPANWFRDPGLVGPTPMTVTAEGRIYGHCALWSTCHTAYGDLCVTAPRSRTNYAYFNTGAVLAKDGTQIPVGHITMGIGHADPRYSATAATEHYDNVNSVVADITVGEDAFGIWMSGAVRDGISPETVRELRAAAVSGDWRTINGNLELVAMLSVPVPGFPVPRIRAMVASGAVTSLVASACFESEANVEDETVVAEHPADVAEVAPEEVVAALVEEEPATAPEVEEDDAPDNEEESPAEEKSEMAELREMIAALTVAVQELRQPVEEVEAPTEEAAVVEVVDAVPAVEQASDALLKALDALAGVDAGGDKPNIGQLLADLDAKVG